MKEFSFSVTETVVIERHYVVVAETETTARVLR